MTIKDTITAAGYTALAIIVMVAVYYSILELAEYVLENMGGVK